MVGNLWVWVIAAFVAVIIAWVWTGWIAKGFDYKRISEEEERRIQEASQHNN